MKRISLCLVVLLIMFCGSVNAAESNEWKDKNYDWNKVKTIFILPIRLSNDVTDQFAIQKASEIISAELMKCNVTLLGFRDALTQVKNETGIDLDELQKTDRDKAVKILGNYVSSRADLVLSCNVYQMGWTKQYVPPRSFTYTTHKTSTITSSTSGVVGWINTPVQNQVNIPGGYKDFPTAAVGIILYSTDGKIVWGYMDVKDDRGGGLFSRNNLPEDNLKSIVVKAFNKMPLQKKPNEK